MQRRRALRVAIGVGLGVFVLGPLAATSALAQSTDSIEVPPVDVAAVDEAIMRYAQALAGLDIDGDGVADLGDPDGDGVPNLLGGPPEDRPAAGADADFAGPLRASLDKVGMELATTLRDGSDVTGSCSGMILGFDADGQLTDWAAGVGDGASGGPNGQLIDLYGDGQVGTRALTSDNPFAVGEAVVWVGGMAPLDGEGPAGLDWRFSVAGIPLTTGEAANAAGLNFAVRRIELTEQVPDLVRPSGVYPIEARLLSETGPACQVGGWMEAQAPNPFLSAPSALAAIIGLTGATGLIFGSRPARVWKVKR